MAETQTSILVVDDEPMVTEIVEMLVRAETGWDVVTFHDPQRAADLQLRDRFLDGDPEAARDLCERHLDDLYAFVHWRVGGDRARAEDLVQDTLLVALQRIGSFDGRARLSTWLEGIARNRLRSERRKRRPVPLEDVLAESEGEIDAILAEVAREPLPEWVLEEQETKDLVGATLSSLGLFGLVFAIIEAPQRGWLDALCVAAAAAGVLLLAAFVLYELARRDPMLDPRLFARRGFGVGSLSLMLQFFAQFGFLFVALQYLQFVLGYTPLEAGASILPMAIMLIAISPRAPRLADRLGVRIVGGVGLALMGVGFLVFTALDPDSTYWLFGTGAVITGVGLALATAPATTCSIRNTSPPRCAWAER